MRGILNEGPAIEPLRLIYMTSVSLATGHGRYPELHTLVINYYSQQKSYNILPSGPADESIRYKSFSNGGPCKPCLWKLMLSARVAEELNRHGGGLMSSSLATSDTLRRDTPALSYKERLLCGSHKQDKF